MADFQNDQMTRAIAIGSPKRVFDAAKMLELNLRISEGADQSLYAARRAAEESDDELKKIAASPVGKLYYMFTILLTPAYLQAVNAHSRVAAWRDCADAAIAAELYRRQSGKWPARLGDLVPQYLPAVPTDPFTNQPLLTKESPESFRVYSAGPDSKDDGGNLTSDMKPGTDIGFEMPVLKGR